MLFKEMPNPFHMGENSVFNPSYLEKVCLAGEGYKGFFVREEMLGGLAGGSKEMTGYYGVPMFGGFNS